MSSDVEQAVFEPEVILPAQLSWGARCDGNTSGARALMLAILEDVVLCIERGRRRRHPRTRLLAAGAQEWVCSDSTEWIFSFVSICDVLGIDANALRVRLTNLEHPANGVRTTCAQADEPPARSGAGFRLLPRREGARGETAVGGVRATARRTIGGRGTEAGFAALARTGEASSSAISTAAF